MRKWYKLQICNLFTPKKIPHTNANMSYWHLSYLHSLYTQTCFLFRLLLFSLLYSNQFNLFSVNWWQNHTVYALIIWSKNSLLNTCFRVHPFGGFCATRCVSGNKSHSTQAQNWILCRAYANLKIFKLFFGNSFHSRINSFCWLVRIVRLRLIFTKTRKSE